MQQPRGTWPVARWAGLVAVVPLVLVVMASFAASLSFLFQWDNLEGHATRIVRLHRAKLLYVSDLDTTPEAIPIESSWNFYVDPDRKYLRWWPIQVPGPATYTLVVPLWLPLAAIALPTGALWWPVMVARHRARGWQCRSCGYDLRGIAAGAVCPECGGGAGTAAGTVP